MTRWTSARRSKRILFLKPRAMRCSRSLAARLSRCGSMHTIVAPSTAASPGEARKETAEGSGDGEPGPRHDQEDYPDGTFGEEVDEPRSKRQADVVPDLLSRGVRHRDVTDEAEAEGSEEPDRPCKRR